jgi:hypothetical protein
MDLIWSSRCLALFCTSTQSNNLKWASGGGINSPRHQTSRWLKAVESSTIGWSDVMLFRALVHPVLVAVALHCTWLLTQLIWRFIRRTVSSSGAEDFAAKTLLFTFSRPSDEPLLHRRFIRCYCSSIGASVLFRLGHRIDQRCSPMDRRFIRRIWLHCFVSSIHPTHVEWGLSVHPTVPVDLTLHAVYQVLRRLHRRPLLGTVGSSDDVIFLPFLPRFGPSKNILYSHFVMLYFCIHVN